MVTCGFLLCALLKLLKFVIASLLIRLSFFSLPYFLLLAPFSSAYDNGQEEERNIVFKHRERNIAGMKKTALPVEVV